MDALFYVADNTGNGVLYEILPVDTANKIPKRRNPVTLIRSVVRRWELDSTYAPSCIESHAGFKFYDRSGDALFMKKATKTVPTVWTQPILVHTMNHVWLLA